MKHLTHFKLFESVQSLTLADYGWLYFITYSSQNVMSVKSWGNDSRMGDGTSPGKSFEKFPFIEITDKEYLLKDRDKARKILNDRFDCKTFKGAIRSSKKLPGRGDDVMRYPMNTIPEDIYMHEHPKLEKYFSKISERFRSHWNANSSNPHILDVFSRSRGIKEYNFKNYFETFPDEPNSFIIYRGIKSDYDSGYLSDGYSCWTTSKDQGIRFAKHHFSGGKQFGPDYSKKAVLLSTEVSLKDVSIFIGGTEHEVVIKNPVGNVTVTELEPGKG